MGHLTMLRPTLAGRGAQRVDKMPILTFLGGATCAGKRTGNSSQLAWEKTSQSDGSAR